MKRPWRIEVRKSGKGWVRLLGNYATEENARRAIEKEALGWYFSFAPKTEFRYRNVLVHDKTETRFINREAPDA